MFVRKMLARALPLTALGLAAWLLTGPPISTDIIPPSNAPSNIALAPFNPFNPLLINVFNAPIGGSTTYVIKTPTIKIPNNG